MLGGNHDQALLLNDLPGSAVCTCQVGRSVLFSYCEGAIRGIIMLFGIGNIDNPSCCRLLIFQYQEFGKRGQSSGTLVLAKLAVPTDGDRFYLLVCFSQGLASGSLTRRGLLFVTRGAAPKDQRATLAPPPVINFSTSASDAIEVSPAVVIARAP